MTYWLWSLANQYTTQQGKHRKEEVDGKVVCLKLSRSGPALWGLVRNVCICVPSLIICDIISAKCYTRTNSCPVQLPSSAVSRVAISFHSLIVSVIFQLSPSHLPGLQISTERAVSGKILINGASDFTGIHSRLVCLVFPSSPPQNLCSETLSGCLAKAAS